MPPVPEPCLDRLRAAGLLVSEPFVAGHVAFPEGVMVAKPKGAGGNTHPSFGSTWGAAAAVVDAPPVYLHGDGRYWYVTSMDLVPGPGPGDFVHAWRRPEEAVADILDFYFGNPARMRAKRRPG